VQCSVFATREFLRHDLQAILSISGRSHKQKIRHRLQTYAGYQWKELKQIHVPYEDILVSDRVTGIHRIPVKIRSRFPDTRAILSGCEQLAALNHVFASIHASQRCGLKSMD